MRSFWAGIILSLLASTAVAQTSVRQSGSSVTANTVPYWVSNGIIGDSVTADDSPISSFGVTKNGGSGICVSSGRSTVARNQLCFGVTLDSAATISLQNYGGATAQNLNFVINGTAVTLPTGGGTFATLTGSPPYVLNELVNFFNTNGTLGSSGITANAGLITVGQWNATPVAVLYGGTGASTAASARTNLGLGTMATQNASAVAITGGSVTGLPAPSANTDAATKAYVDATSTGLNILATTTLATAAVLPNSPTYSNGASGVGATLTAGSNTTLTVDGTAAPLSTVVLVKNQATAAQNGIYTVTTAGSGAAPWVLTRATYFDQAAEMKAGSYTFVTTGTANANTSWTLQTAVTTVGSDSLTFVQFSAASTGTVTQAIIAAGTGISVSGTCTITTNGTCTVTNAGVTTIAGNAGDFTLTAPLTNSTNAILLNATIFPQGRLTLVTGTPVMTTSQSAKTSVFYTPYVGNLIPIYDGTNFIPKSFSELTITLGSNWLANTVYDVFVASDSGTLRACTGPSWASDTSRGTGGGTSELERVNGILMNKVSVTCRYDNATTFAVAADRGTYVGTFRTGSSTGQTNYIFGAAASGGTAGNFGVWNMYNRVSVPTTVTDSGTSYTYASGTIHQMRTSTGMQISAVRGMDEEAVELSGWVSATSSFAGAIVSFGVGVDSTTAFPSGVGGKTTLQVPVADEAYPLFWNYRAYPGLGYHTFAFLEVTDGNTFTINQLTAITSNYFSWNERR